ncbi:Endogenous retrovirus group K member 9 Pol protein [Manis javanica]|nr:Endogenous retrovirus group K member 9 Pol protein [Manis javanica]
MVSSEKELYISQGERTAQSLLLPCLPPSTTSYERGKGGFGSTNKQIWLNTKITAERPQSKVYIQGKSFTELLDTGAHVSVIALKHWLKNWPKQEKHVQVSCIGTASQVWQSSATLCCLDPEDQLALLKPLIVEVAINLQG